jgi:hypothetical protein
LTDAFERLERIAADESDGHAWLLARRRAPSAGD